MNRLKQFIIRHVIGFTRWLGGILLPLSAVILGIGFQSEFVWNRHTLAIILWVTCGLLFLMSVMVIIINGILTYRKEKRDEPF